MYQFLRGGVADRNPLTAGPGNLAIRRLRPFQDHVGPPLRPGFEICGIELPGLFVAQSFLDGDSRLAEHIQPLAADQGIGIEARRHHARNLRRDQRRAHAGVFLCSCGQHGSSVT